MIGTTQYINTRPPSNLAPHMETKGTSNLLIRLIADMHKCSLYELRELQEQLSLEVAKRLELKPDVDMYVTFSDGEAVYSGTVIRKNKGSVTVLRDDNNSRMVVKLADIRSCSRVKKLVGGKKGT